MLMLYANISQDDNMIGFELIEIRNMHAFNVLYETHNL